MSERDSLMAAVLAEPDSDVPRLVYADWLEEYPRHEADTARAQFIRLEIEAEQLPKESEHRAALERQAAVFFNRHHHAWNAEIPTWNEWYDSVLVYRRGFPFELRTVFLKLAYSNAVLFDTIPIQSLVLTTRVGYVHYERHQVLTGNGASASSGGDVATTTGTSVPSLFAGTHRTRHDLSRIVRLQIGPGVRVNAITSNMGDDDRSGLFEMIAGYPSLANLQELSFAGNNLDDNNLFALMNVLRKAVFVEGLLALDLSDNRITDAGASTWTATGTLEGLATLNLAGNQIGSSAKRSLRNRFGNRVILE
jgi:uncharacterized protein (TIGR02996 family)